MVVNTASCHVWKEDGEQSAAGQGIDKTLKKMYMDWP